jgi:hypothetical protein
LRVGRDAENVLARELPAYQYEAAVRIPEDQWSPLGAVVDHANEHAEERREGHHPPVIRGFRAVNIVRVALDVVIGGWDVGARPRPRRQAPHERQHGSVDGARVPFGAHKNPRRPDTGAEGGARAGASPQVDCQ